MAVLVRWPLWGGRDVIRQFLMFREYKIFFSVHAYCVPYNHGNPITYVQCIMYTDKIHKRLRLSLESKF